jgi:DNA-binding YbaB/EbfC family protein
MNVQKLMKEAQRAQKAMAEAQERIASMRVEGNAGGGLVRVTASGDGKVTAVSIDPKVIDPSDPSLLEDLVTAAVGDAQRQAQALQEREMGSIMGGSGLGGLL